MENEIYIANKAADTINTFSTETQEKVAQVIDSLGGDGWKNSLPVANGHGLRTARSGSIGVVFSVAPEQHAIIVVDVTSRIDRELAMAV